ncbi:unnamed protein product [Closterium sp. Naga37s-1]|nr:unnamed protein product [Closterium sp. Naga37s-1]
MALIPSPQHRNYRNLSVLPALPVHPLPVGSPHTPRPRFFLGPLRSRSLAYQELMLPVLPIAPSSPHGASLSRSTYNGPLSSSCIHFTIYNPPRFSYSSCTMAAQIYNPDHTMSAAEEEALGASRDDLAVDDLPEGMFHHLADPADLPAAKKSCMVPDASPAPNPSPATSSGSVPALPAHSPVPLTIAALSAPLFGLAPSLVATAASPNSPVTRATTYASVASGSNLAPALPASLFASPTPGGAPRNLRRARTDAAVPLPFRMCRRMVVNVLLPKAGLESHRSEIFAGINAQVCGFMFSSGIIPSFEQTIGDPYRVARQVYGRLLFSWPSQDDAAAFRKLFPLTLKVSNSHPFLLKVFEDTLEAFTAAKAAAMLPHLLLALPLWSPCTPLSALHFDISPHLLQYLPALPELQFSPTLLCPIVASSPSALPAAGPPRSLKPTTPLHSIPASPPPRSQRAPLKLPPSSPTLNPPMPNVSSPPAPPAPLPLGLTPPPLA